LSTTEKEKPRTSRKEKKRKSIRVRARESRKKPRNLLAGRSCRENAGPGIFDIDDASGLKKRLLPVASEGKRERVTAGNSEREKRRKSVLN